MCSPVTGSTPAWSDPLLTVSAGPSCPTWRTGTPCGLPAGLYLAIPTREISPPTGLTCSPLSNCNSSSRSARQKYIFWEIEPPAYLDTFKPDNYNNFFNWTISFREDSSVQLPYGGVKREKDHPEGEELKRLVTSFGRENTHLAVRNSSEGQATVAWMVSNCLTESNREGYIEDLRKHINIDIYGPCYKGDTGNTQYTNPCL